jgi:HrpA-like RNA helicase
MPVRQFFPTGLRLLSHRRKKYWVSAPHRQQSDLPSHLDVLMQSRFFPAMLRLPMHPRFSRMLLEAREYQVVRPAALCAALVSGRDLLARLDRDDAETKAAREMFEGSGNSDFLTLMRAYDFAKANGFGFDRCRSYGINAQVARQVEQTFQQIMHAAQQIDSPRHSPQFSNLPANLSDQPESQKSSSRFREASRLV